ncbi:MAG: helix-turn-helix transcriptional regulator, partial [Bacillota bacterium]
MDSKELGKKIKEARIAKKMTQSEVVGNFITRNMLSQIESGNATPSVKTLGYLSHVLQIP